MESHTIRCHWVYLSLFFVVTPASCHNALPARALFAIIVLLYHHQHMRAVWADAKYLKHSLWALPTTYATLLSASVVAHSSRGNGYSILCSSGRGES